MNSPDSSAPKVRRILIVEDDSTISQMIEETLSGEGYVTARAASAQDGFRLIREFKPHLVLTDQDMPGLTGLEMLRELRSQLNYVAVIFVSGRSDATMVTQALKAGADDYIRKPFRFGELTARVESCLRTHDLHVDLLEANQRLQDMIDRDHLTGLFNMRTMYDRIDGEIKRVVRHHRSMAAVMLDMDHFKSVNDSHDHLFGSFVLKEVGKIIQATMRESDFAARYGGDEFLIILTDTDTQGAKVFCERLRARTEAYEFNDGKNRIRLTMSVGCSVSTALESINARDLVRRADKALYRAKELGRNCVFIDDSISSTPP